MMEEHYIDVNPTASTMVQSPEAGLLSLLPIVEVAGTIERVRSKGGVGKIEGGDASTPKLSGLSEWPEIVEIIGKLSSGKEIAGKDELWINELAEATGWDKNAIIDELTNLAADPSERARRYEELYEEYSKNAEELKEKGDTRQAGEKLWGAVTALIKLYAAKRGIPVLHWSRGKLEKFVTNNVESKHKKLFRDLLAEAQVFHEHFYEASLDEKTFEERWRSVIDNLEKARKVIAA